METKGQDVRTCPPQPQAPITHPHAIWGTPALPSPRPSGPILHPKGPSVQKPVRQMRGAEPLDRPVISLPANTCTVFSAFICWGGHEHSGPQQQASGATCRATPSSPEWILGLECACTRILAGLLESRWPGPTLSGGLRRCISDKLRGDATGLGAAA